MGREGLSRDGSRRVGAKERRARQKGEESDPRQGRRAAAPGGFYVRHRGIAMGGSFAGVVNARLAHCGGAVRTIPGAPGVKALSVVTPDGHLTRILAGALPSAYPKKEAALDWLR